MPMLKSRVLVWKNMHTAQLSGRVRGCASPQPMSRSKTSPPPLMKTGQKWSTKSRSRSDSAGWTAGRTNDRMKGLWPMWDMTGQRPSPARTPS